MDIEQENESLIEEIANAHKKLNEIGVGKTHWSLSGRIEVLLIMLHNNDLQIPLYIQEYNALVGL